MNLAMIDPQIDEAAHTCRVVIETPKRSRSKYGWDPSIEVLELSGLLPVGMSFPLDFSMVPRTVAEDGDPLDVPVIGDEPDVAGCVVTVRLLGITQAEQTEKGRTYRNDRLLARKALSISCAHANHIDDLGAAFVDHLGRWFEQFDALKVRLQGDRDRRARRSD